MPQSRIIVDGYNLLARRGRLVGQALDLARQDLIRLFEPLVGDLAERITLVFDGRSDRSERGEEAGLQLVFSGGQLSADGVIVALVRAEARPDEILVVSSDRFVREAAEAAGAQTVASGVFLEQLQARPTRDTRSGLAFRPTLGDLFPAVPTSALPASSRQHSHGKDR
jgi:predicted RNA-binding protein with PIN domain